MKGKKLLKSITAIVLAFVLALAPVGDIPVLRELGITARAATAESDFAFESSTGTITKYNGSAAVVEIPSTIGGVAVTAIGVDAFRNNKVITSVTIPDSVTVIENYAFRWCESLTSVTIPGNVTSIGDQAFAYCKALTSVTILDGVENINIAAFGYCTLLTSVNIPSSVTSIGANAFIDCSRLTSVTYDGTETEWGKIDGKENVSSVTFNKFDITFDANGGTGTVDAVIATRGNSVTLPANGFTAPAGRKFKCWAIGSANSATTVTAGGTYTFTADTTVYAVWENCNYTVTFNVGSGTINAGNVTTYTYGTGATLPTNVTRTGYTFGGWYENSDCTGTAVTTISTTATGAKTFYAKWTENIISDSMAKVEGATVTYDGSAHSPKVTGSDNTVAIKYGTTEGTYDLTSAPAYTDAGTYTIYYKASKDNYIDKTGSVTITINPCPINAVWGAAELTYNKNTQASTVTTPVDGANGEKVNIERTIEHTTPGTYTSTASIVSVTGGQKKTGNYTLNNTEKTFKIVAKPISDISITVTLSENEYIYDGTEKKPEVTVEDTEGTTSTLAEGTDYTYSYTNHKNAGTATVTIEGIGNYTGTTSKTFTIQPKEVNDPVIVLSKDTFEYTGTAKEPAVTVKDGDTVIAAAEYTVGYTDNTAAGEATVTITDNPNGNYTVNGSTTFTIEKQIVNIPDSKPTSAKINLSRSSFTYTGDYFEPGVGVVDNYGEIIPASEYELTYKNNRNAGTAEVLIANKDGGNYIVNGSRTFEIEPATITGITATGYDDTYDGMEHSITVTGAIAGDKIEYSTDGIAYSETNPALKDAGIYTVYYKVTRDNYYDLTEFAMVAIKRKDVTISGVAAADKTYDGSTTASVSGTPELGGLVASDEDEVSVSVGTAAFADKNAGTDKPVTFTGFTLTGDKADNYRLSAQPESVTASISAAPVTITWSQETITYNGKPQKPGFSVSGIVDGDDCSVTVSGEETNAGGPYTATADLTGAEIVNYILSGETSKDFTIERKALTDDMIALNNADRAYSYTGSAVTPVVTVSDDAAALTPGDDYTTGGEESAKAVGSHDLTVTGQGNYKGTVTVTWTIKDPNPPTGSITVSTNSWNAFLHTITFGLFFKETQTVTITGTDGADESGVDKLYYYLSATELDSEGVALVTDWTELSATGDTEKTGSFTVESGRKLIIYAKITDKSGNVAYINSNGIIVDATAPVIEGVTDGGSYCAEQTVTISDDNLDTVTVNGTEVALAGGQYTLAADGTEYTIVATDKAGNSTTVTVTVNDGHTPAADAAKAPTCTETGLTEGSHCSVCNTVLVPQTEIAVTEHTWESEPTIDKAATCTEEGSRSIHCSMCDATKDPEAIPLTGHTPGEEEEENRVAAACTEDGSYEAVVYCAICRAELDREERAIEKTGHSFGEWEEVDSPNCTEKGSRKRSCTACGYTETEDVDATGHSWEDGYTTDKEATCTEDGSRSIHCSKCDVVKDSETILMTGHTPVTDAAKAPTCTETGLTEGSHCSACNTVLVAQTSVAATGHTAGEGKEENRSEATCTQDGSYETAVYCEICHAELSREKKTIEKTGHSFGKWKEVKSPNCTEKGSRKRSCTACSYTETKDVDAAGHSWEGSYTTDNAATCTADGSKSIHCSQCGAVKDSTVIPATGHNYSDEKDATCNVCGYTRTVEKPKNAAQQAGAGDKKQPGNDDKKPDQQAEAGDEEQLGNDDKKPDQQAENDDKQSDQQPGNDGEQPDFAGNDGEPLAITGEKVVLGSVPEAESVEKTLDVGRGEVVVTVVCEDEDYTAGVADAVAVANAVLLPEQLEHVYSGDTVEIRVDIQDISEHVPVSEKEAVEECIEQQTEIADLQLGMYIDISIYIRTGDGDWDSVTQTNEPIDVVIGIPEELRGEGRTYYIIRSHEGGIALLYDMDDVDDTITIRTGQFSTYAIAYDQVTAKMTAPGTANTPFALVMSGISALKADMFGGAWVIAGMLAVAVIALLLLARGCRYYFGRVSDY